MCSEKSSACKAPASLLQGSAANIEPNQLDSDVRASNTIDNCQDGTESAYDTDESVEWLSIVSVDPDTGEPWDLPLVVGGKAKIITGLHAYIVGDADPSNDYADFYYSKGVDAPSWTFLGTKQLLQGEVDSAGFGDFTSAPFTLAEGTQSMQAIRVDFRYGGSKSAVACTGGSWADTDDLAFYVAPATAPPTSLVSMLCVNVSRKVFLTSLTLLIVVSSANFEPIEISYIQSYQGSVEQCTFALWLTLNRLGTLNWLTFTRVSSQLICQVRSQLQSQ